MKCDICTERKADLQFNNTNDGLEPANVCRHCAREYGEQVKESFKDKCKRYDWNEKEGKWKKKTKRKKKGK
jgi:protein-arginine kinase activator protein McsA